MNILYIIWTKNGFCYIVMIYMVLYEIMYKTEEWLMANYEEKTVLMDEMTAKRAISRIAYEILERNRGTKDLVIIGIQTEGVLLAKLIIKKIEEIEGIKLELGSLDITFYRDDLTRLSKHPIVAGNDIAFSIEDKTIILVDDVLYSGRTIRAAMEELFDMGRPKKIELAVLVDRGGRELPIRADYVGKEVPTSRDEYINVVINDEKLAKVSICSKGEK